MYKICVYAIAKNEIKFINRWYESMKEADYICVLDTGSTDGTYEKLQQLNIITKQKKYNKFRFDVARNESMKLIPKDTTICVCVDLDEIFEAGWSQILKENWTDSTIRASYRYTWNFDKEGNEGIVFMLDKAHKKDEFIWTYPVHEILTRINNKPYNTISLPNIQLNHHADNTKSRSNYLPLLELSVKENPTNDRNMHYLGREYLFHNEYNKAIKTLKKHLSLPTAIWDVERSASLRYIAHCYKMKNQLNKYEEYLILSIIECNYVRESYFELGKYYYEKNNFVKAAFIFNEMFKIQNRYLNYMSSPVCWDYLPYDYLSICYYQLKDYKKAILAVNEAIKLKNNKRLIDNKNYFIKKLNENQIKK